MKKQVLWIACIAVMSSSFGATAAEESMTVADLQKICIGTDAQSKAACRYYILGITQGVSMGIGIADGKTKGGRPCIPDNIAGTSLELVVKMKLGQDLMVFPDDAKLDASGLIGAILLNQFPCQK